MPEQLGPQDVCLMLLSVSQPELAPDLLGLGTVSSDGFQGALGATSPSAQRMGDLGKPETLS